MPLNIFSMQLADKWCVLVCFILLLVIPSDVLASGHTHDVEELKRKQVLYDKVRCPTCVAQSIKESGSIASRQIKHYINHRIAQGATDEEIVREISEYYGPSVMLDQTQARYGNYFILCLLSGTLFYILKRKFNRQNNVLK
jgi:cytochrome c-type biogenesis protein CcmH/NrfF